MDFFRLLMEHLARIEHQFMSGIRDWRKSGSLWGMMRGVGRIRRSEHKSWLGKGLGLGLLCWGFKGVPEENLQIGSVAPVYNSILVTDYLTKMGITTVPRPPYRPDLAPCDFWLFPQRLSLWDNWGVKEAVTKVIDTLTQENFHGTFQKLLERYNKCIAAEEDYFEGEYSFMCELSIKVPIWKKSGNLFNDPRMTFMKVGWFSDWF